MLRAIDMRPRCDAPALTAAAGQARMSYYSARGAAVANKLARHAGAEQPGWAGRRRVLLPERPSSVPSNLSLGSTSERRNTRSTALTLDEGAGKVAELRYSAWGETRYTDGSTPTQRRYTGQLEAEAGLYYYQARW